MVMKLSEAIRLGSMLGPQESGWFYNKSTGGMCVMGAALAAMGRLDRRDESVFKHNNFNAACELWPWIHKYIYNNRSLSDYIVFENDTLKRTREQLADLVESIERKLEVHDDTNIPTNEHRDMGQMQAEVSPSARVTVGAQAGY